jgi:Immunity protein 74
VTVEGEGYARGYGSPDFVIYKNSIQRWDPPFDEVPIDECTKDRIIADLATEMAAKGMTIEVE